MERCLDGQPEAFGHVVRQYQSPLLSYLMGRLGDADQAEEAAQETFVRAYFALGRLKQPESLYSWLIGIASRVTKESQRSRRRHRRLVLAARESRDPPGAADPALDRALAELPDLYREVIVLRYFRGLSCKQAGEQLGIPLGAVTKRLSRAYAMLRKLLRSHQGDEVRS